MSTLAKAVARSQRGRRQLVVGSLRNRVREADQGNGEWWLKDARRAVRSALAEELEMSLASLETRLKAQPVSKDSHQIELEPFPGLSFDPRGPEPFMPGFPPELTQEEGRRIERAWWVVEDGTEKWVAPWLGARHDWEHLEFPTWTPEKLPRRGRALVVLASTEGMTIESIKDVPAALQLCVASPKRAPGWPQKEEDRRKGAEGPRKEPFVMPRRPVLNPAEGKRDQDQSPWRELRFPATSEWLDGLVDWVSSRIKQPNFSADAARRLLREEYGASAAEPSEVLAFLALITTVGVEAFRRRDRREVLRDWIKNAEARRSGDLIGGDGDELLLDLELERLRAVQATELTAAEWSQLVPRSFAPSLDRKKLRSLLKSQKSEDVLARIEPDGHEWVSALQRAGVLRATRDGRHQLHPPWLARAVTEMAFDALWATDKLDTLMLNASTSAMAIRELVDELRDGDERRIKRWLAKDSTQPGWLAVCDGIFRAVGLALTIPRVKVSESVVRRVWEIFERSSEPYRDEKWPATPWISVGGATGLQSEGAHYLAAAALSLRLKRGGSAFFPTAEWLGKETWGGAKEISHRVFEAISQAMSASAPGSDEALAPYRLGDLLWDELQDGDGHGVWALDELQRPTKIAKLAIKGGTHFDWPAIEDACARHGVSVEAALAHAWSRCHSWAHSDFDKQPFSEQALTRLFSAVTGDHLRAADKWARGDGEERSDVYFEIPWMKRPEVWPHLQPSVWEYWFESRHDASPEMVERMPEQFALRLLDWNWSWSGFSHAEKIDELARALWRKIPQHVADHVVAAVGGREPWGKVRLLAYNAPDDLCAEIIGKLPDARSDDLRFWLIDLVSKRRPGWQRAAELLAGDATARRFPP